MFEVEPLPKTSPLWTHPKVFVTPHAAATSDPAHLVAPMLAQMDAFERGEKLANLVDREAGCSGDGFTAWPDPSARKHCLMARREDSGCSFGRSSRSEHRPVSLRGFSACITAIWWIMSHLMLSRPPSRPPRLDSRTAFVGNSAADLPAWRYPAGSVPSPAESVAACKSSSFRPSPNARRRLRVMQSDEFALWTRFPMPVLGRWWSKIEVNDLQVALAGNSVGKGRLAAVGRPQDADAVAKVREIHPTVPYAARVVGWRFRRRCSLDLNRAERTSSACCRLAAVAAVDQRFMASISPVALSLSRWALSACRA